MPSAASSRVSPTYSLRRSSSASNVFTSEQGTPTKKSKPAATRRSTKWSAGRLPLMEAASSRPRPPDLHLLPLAEGLAQQGDEGRVRAGLREGVERGLIDVVVLILGRLLLELIRQELELLLGDRTERGTRLLVVELDHRVLLRGSSPRRGAIAGLARRQEARLAHAPSHPGLGGRPGNGGGCGERSGGCERRAPSPAPSPPSPPLPRRTPTAPPRRTPGGSLRWCRSPSSPCRCRPTRPGGRGR